MIVRADLTADEAEIIRQEAARRGVTMNEYAREIISQHLGYWLEVERMQPPAFTPNHYTLSDGAPVGGS